MAMVPKGEKPHGDSVWAGSVDGNEQIKNNSSRGLLILLKAHKSQRTMLHIDCYATDSSVNEDEREIWKAKHRKGLPVIQIVLCKRAVVPSSPSSYECHNNTF